jgi:predicted transcriptional regulator
MVNFEHQADPMVLGLQRYLSMVNHPIPDEHLKAFEAHAPEEAGASSGHELTVAEVMTRRVVCVLESTTIEQVASICNRRGFSGVPVVNQNQALIGIVTLTDIMHQLLDQKSLSTYAEQGGEVLEQKALAILDEPVRNYMHRDVITVLPETTVREACQLMMKHRIRRLVVARGDLVRGIFSAQDAVQVLATAELKVDEENQSGT